MRSERYRWSAFFAWGLTLSGAALALVGIVGAFSPGLDGELAASIGGVTFLVGVVSFAFMMGFAIGLTNCVAAGALQAMKHRKRDGGQTDWAVFLPAVVCTVGFAFAANAGIHIGWDMVKLKAGVPAALPTEATIDLVFYILAFAKPATAWIREGRLAMDQETAEIAARVETPAPAAAPRPAETHAAPAAGTATVHNIETERRRRSDLTETDIKDAAERIVARGERPSFRSLAAELNVSRSKVERTWPRGVPFAA